MTPSNCHSNLVSLPQKKILIRKKRVGKDGDGEWGSDRCDPLMFEPHLIVPMCRVVVCSFAMDSIDREKRECRRCREIIGKYRGRVEKKKKWDFLSRGGKSTWLDAMT